MDYQPKYEMLPAHLREGAQRYVEGGVLPGGFLRAALANDFVGAVNRADAETVTRLRDVALFVYNELPERAWGSRAKVKAWAENQAARAQARREAAALAGKDRCLNCGAGAGEAHHPDCVWASKRPQSVAEAADAGEIPSAGAADALALSGGDPDDGPL